jgi:hypothetical protein
VLAVDELVRPLVHKHFARALDEVDELAYLDAMERFGRDVLPENRERFALIPADDPRKSTAMHHTIEGDIMWLAGQCTSSARNWSRPRTVKPRRFVA